MNCCSYVFIYLENHRRGSTGSERGGYFSGVRAKKGERKLSTAGGRCKLNLVAKEVITTGTCPVAVAWRIYTCAS